MPIAGKYFPSQKSQEKVFLLLRRHWFTYFGFVAVALIISISLIVVAVVWISRPDYFSGILGHFAILAIFSYILFALGLMLYGFIDYYLDVYIITNERIVNIEQNGFFRREISELHLHQIQDVSARVNGFLPTMFHYGDVFIQTAAERENFIFKSIPNPYRVSKLIVDLHEAQLEESPRQDMVSDQMFSDDGKIEFSGKARDQFDLENVNPASLSLARKRTKEFLNGSPVEETDLKNAVEESLSDTQNQKLLLGVNGAKVSPQADYQATTERTESSSNQNVTKTKAQKEGEIHENEEIDF